MLPEKGDVVCQLPVVSLLLCFRHIPTFVLPSYCIHRALRVRLVPAYLLLVITLWTDTSSPATIPCYLALPTGRLASNACLRHGATATMLDLYTSSVQDSPRSAPVPRLWL